MTRADREPRGAARALLALLATACARPAPPPELPRLADASGIDRLVLERVDEAIAAFEQGQESAALELGLVYEANELDVLAVRTYEICLGIPSLPAAEVHFHRGRALAAVGRSEEAAASFAAALALDDSYVPAHWRYAQVLLEAGRIAEARAQLERAIALEPGNVAARLWMARVQLVEDDPAGAIETLAPVVERRADERFVHALLSRAYQALGDARRAAEELELEKGAGHVSMADPLTAEMRKRATGIIPAVRKANDALAAGKSEEALRILEPVYARDPEKLAIVQMIAKALIENGQVERALTVLETGARLHPDDYKVELLTGAALMRQEDLEGALRHLVRARELNPAYGPTHATLGEIYARLERFAEAEEALAVAVAGGDGGGDVGGDSDDAQGGVGVELRTFLLLGQVQMDQAAWERAIETFQRACGRFPTAAAWAHLAEAQARSGNRDAASASLAKAEALNATHPRLVHVRRLLAGGGAEPR